MESKVKRHALKRLEKIKFKYIPEDRKVNIFKNAEKYYDILHNSLIGESNKNHKNYYFYIMEYLSKESLKCKELFRKKFECKKWKK